MTRIRYVTIEVTSGPSKLKAGATEKRWDKLIAHTVSTAFIVAIRSEISAAAGKRNFKYRNRVTEARGDLTVIQGANERCSMSAYKLNNLRLGLVYSQS